MGFGKKPAPKKNKGPKGKKARAKAISDRQWGETVDEDAMKKARQRRGKSRLTTTTTSTTKKSSLRNAEEVAPSFQEKILQHKWQLAEGGGTSHNRQQNYDDREHHRRGSVRSDASEDENDEESSKDGSDEEMTTMPVTNLLQSIHKTTKKRQKEEKRQQQAALIESEEEDEDTGGEDSDQDHSMEEDNNDDDDDDDTSMSSRASDDDDDKDRAATTNGIRMKDDDEDSIIPAASVVDFFGQRFNQSSEDQAALPATTTSQKKLSMEKVPILHSTNVELQLSPSPYNNKNDTSAAEFLRRHGSTGISSTARISETNASESTLQSPTLEEWQTLSQEAFAGNRQVLQRQWKLFNNKDKHKKKKSPPHPSLTTTANQSYLYPFLTRYMDLLVTTNSEVSSSASTLSKNRDEWHRLYVLHVLNHVLTARGRIQRHNKQIKDREDAQLKAKKESEDQKDDVDDEKNAKDKSNKATSNDSDNEEDEEVDEEKWRDQGFTRATVLVLMPTRRVAYRFVQDLLEVLGKKDSMKPEYMERLEAEYGDVAAATAEGGDGKGRNVGNDEKERRRKAVLERKGAGWLELFGDTANHDDDFKMGISLTPKAAGGAKKVPKSGNQTSTTGSDNSNVSVKLYSDFYKSDIILASPLGLKVPATKPHSREPENDDDNDDGNGDFDYLSSIEICLVQYADVLMMQNWDHVNDILSVLNQQPQKNNDTDFSRVRNYCLEGKAAHWRQLILSSHIMDPCILSTFTRYAKSIAGSMKLRRRVAPEDSSVSSVLVPVRQVFQKVMTSSLAQHGDARIKYFLSSILPAIQRQKQTHTMIYVPSYFDFCSLRNVFLKRKTAFVSVTEYSRVTETSRARARFLQGRTPIMLYTGRAHFFLRHAIRGVKHLIFLGLPEHCEFYADQVNHLMLSSTSSSLPSTTEEDFASAEATVASCLSVFTKYDSHALERVVGTSNCHRMVSSDKSTFMFQS